jgi:hypothetical protein
MSSRLTVAPDRRRAVCTWGGLFCQRGLGHVQCLKPVDLRYEDAHSPAMLSFLRRNHLHPQQLINRPLSGVFRSFALPAIMVRFPVIAVTGRPLSTQ